MENYCKNCGAHIKDDAQFCQECGTKVENTSDICPNCGEKLEENTLFCPECGTNLENICPSCGESTKYNENFCENCGTDLNTPQTARKKININEKNKIPIIIIATVVIVVVIIAATLAFTAKPADVGTQRVSVGINDFIIPGDYKIDPSTIDVDYTGYNAVFSQGYSNGDEIIYIGVMNIPPGVDGESVAASQGGTHKSLMGVSGYYTEDGDGFYSFAFVDGAYLNVVTVSSPYVLDEITYRG